MADRRVVSIGVDIGQRHDPTAIVVAEHIAVQSAPPQHLLPPPGPGLVVLAPSRIRYVGAQTENRFEVRHMERRPLGEPYPAIAARIAQVVSAVDMKTELPVQLTLDITGVGRPVVDLVKDELYLRRVRITGATFTHGDRLHGNAGQREVSVGKAFLVSRLQALLQTDRIALPPAHPESAALAQELLDYEIRIAENANEKYGAFRTGSHDDLVTALGLAVLWEPRRGATLQWV